MGNRLAIGPDLWCSSTAAGTGDMFGIQERLSIKNEIKMAFHKLGGVAVLQKLHEDCLLLSLDLKKRKIEFVLIRQGMKRCVSDGTHSPVVFHVRPARH